MAPAYEQALGVGLPWRGRRFVDIGITELLDRLAYVPQYRRERPPPSAAT